jgi:hypothetical protein
MNKNLQLTLAWFVLAFLVTLAAVWQAQVTVSREVIAKNQLPPPPAKTRHAERGPATTSPSVDYATRKKQGLTDREIGWIIEDFQNAGLDLGIRAAPKEEYLAQRRAQDRWYRDALVDAWSLTPEQSTQVTAKLGELYDQAKADFIEALAAGPQPVEINGQWYIITSAEPIHRLIDANSRLQNADGPFMPWNLGEFFNRSLTPRFEYTNGEASGPLPAEVEITEPIQVIPADPNLLTVDLLLPKTAPSSGDEPAQAVPQENGILSQLRKLHPAQLKLLLLIDPEKAKEIQAALDAG